jgi:HAD superfamily hydrolase (TIGR01662 family)
VVARDQAGKVSMTKAVFFDVDFTLIYPGPTFQGEGYRRFCRRYGIDVDPGSFDRAVASASLILDEVQEDIYDPELFVRYTCHIIEAMGGRGPLVEACAREIATEWGACHHFHLYDDVRPVFEWLHAEGVRIGLISNTHRSLGKFQAHFDLDGLVTTAVSSSEHGYMKPHPSIFEAALARAGVSAPEAVMVGDSVRQDIEGARRVGMRAVLVARSGRPSRLLPDVPVVTTLRDLPAYL